MSVEQKQRLLTPLAIRKALQHKTKQKLEALEGLS